MQTCDGEMIFFLGGRRWRGCSMRHSSCCLGVFHGGSGEVGGRKGKLKAGVHQSRGCLKSRRYYVHTALYASVIVSQFILILRVEYFYRLPSSCRLPCKNGIKIIMSPLSSLYYYYYYCCTRQMVLSWFRKVACATQTIFEKTDSYVILPRSSTVSSTPRHGLNKRT